MGEEELLTIGRHNRPGQQVNLYCKENATLLEYSQLKDRYRIVYIKDGYGVFRNGEKHQIITSPMVLCLNENDTVDICDDTNLLMDIMYFDPICYERYVSYESLQQWKDTLHKEDAYFFRPFLIRSETYIGTLATNYYIGNRISQLITLANRELVEQRDAFWPCRSRSYFIELLFLVNSIYSEDIAFQKVFAGKMTEEINAVLAWIHQHYEDRIVMEDVTREFHTNKTTLNQRFKEVMGVTVIEYIQNFKIQMVCSMLRKTYLPIREIMERAGFKDNAHFIRSFRKYAGCTPTEYRNGFEGNQ